MATYPMKRRKPPLVTEKSQVFTFTRRAFVLGAGPEQSCSSACGTARIHFHRENERYQLLSESNRVQMQLLPPRRGWIVDRFGQPMAINRSDFRVDLIPRPTEGSGPGARPSLRGCSSFLRMRSTASRRSWMSLPDTSPVPVAESIPFEMYAAVTIRQPELPGVSALSSFSRFYPDGAAVGHLLGYVGTPTRGV
jgi:penicillin-binding protein 2